MEQENSSVLLSQLDMIWSVFCETEKNDVKKRLDKHVNESTAGNKKR